MSNELKELSAYYLALYCALNIYMKERLEEIVDLQAYGKYKKSLAGAIKAIDERIQTIVIEPCKQQEIVDELYELTEITEFAFTRLRVNENDCAQTTLNLFLFFELLELQLAGFAKIIIRIKLLRKGNDLEAMMPDYCQLNIMEILQDVLMNRNTL